MVVRTKSKHVQLQAKIEGCTSMTTGDDGSEGESRRM